MRAQAAVHEALLGLAAKKGKKNGVILWPARIAMAGKLVTPCGAIEIAVLLGREEALRRLHASLEKLQKRAKKEAPERCLPIRKHRGAREKRYSFGYAVFLILALMK